MKYFIELSYIGTHYHGWQRQKNVISIQETIENSIFQVLKERLSIIGCGRTDKGVHAGQYFAHIKTEKILSDHDLFKLNNSLPEDIACLNIFEVPANVHAQHSAISRTYTYKLHQKKNPFISHQSVPIDMSGLNIKSMRNALTFLTSWRDYRSLCRNPDQYKTTICNISEAKLFFFNESMEMHIEIKSNRFLRSMMRLLVVNIIRIGQDRLSLNDFCTQIKRGKRFQYFKLAPAKGLCLTAVEYNFPISETSKQHCNQEPNNSKECQ